MTLDRSFLAPDGTLSALTLWPEWVWAIHKLDKRVENRTWKIPSGRWFALHAGAHVGGRKGSVAEAEGWEGVRAMATRAGWVAPAPLWRVHALAKHGRIIQRDPKAPLTSMIHGLFRVRGYVTGDNGSWHVPGQVGNVLDYVPLAEPIPCKGAQGLWTVPADVVERMAVRP